MKKNKESNKVALLLHGFPGLGDNDPIRQYFPSRGYELLIPELFNQSIIFRTDILFKLVEKELKGKIPDIIVGASLGGLLAPVFAAKYPGSKLVMIATGPRVEIGFKPYEFLVKRGEIRLLSGMVRLSHLVPLILYKQIYKILNPYNINGQEKGVYEENIIETYENFQKIPISKLKEILSFVRGLDNSDNLKNINNKTLIIGGGRDIMMPSKLSYELKDLIAESELISNQDRLHYDVFDERDFSKVDIFLEK